MRYAIESTAGRRDATDALRSSIRELAEMSAAPTDWQDGSAMGRVARFEFTLRNGARVHAGANFSGNCVGTVAAIGGSEAAAKRFVDSRTPL
jgi:CRISPR/Cas system CSM-associated protein Csm3 (group 7 of RAMP superfamily)